VLFVSPREVLNCAHGQKEKQKSKAQKSGRQENKLIQKSVAQADCEEEIVAEEKNVSEETFSQNQNEKAANTESREISGNAPQFP
jgi:transcriptional regulator with GAF, ATPase, and Fis domain